MGDFFRNKFCLAALGLFAVIAVLFLSVKQGTGGNLFVNDAGTSTVRVELNRKDAAAMESSLILAGLKRPTQAERKSMISPPTYRIGSPSDDSDCKGVYFLEHFFGPSLGQPGRFSECFLSASDVVQEIQRLEGIYRRTP
jgi:hypothetical protein